MKVFTHKTVLIAEDDQNDLVFMRMAFGQAGMPNPVQTVRDGGEAIAYLAGSGIYADRDQYPFPTLMLLDLKMPCKDGFDVLAWWQRRGKSPDLRIIVLSGSARFALSRSVLECGSPYRCNVVAPSNRRGAQSRDRRHAQTAEDWRSPKPGGNYHLLISASA